MSRRGRSRSRSERPGASGFLVVDKPAGRTSHDIVDEARREVAAKVQLPSGWRASASGRPPVLAMSL